MEPNLIIGPPRIAFDTKVLDDHACLDKYLVLLAIQSFITESTEESLYSTVLPGTVWLDVDRLDLLGR